jgi:proteasome lid subunit RPN8/RPN11
VTIKLYSHDLRNIFTHAESSYPEECCGIMLGNIDEDAKTVVEVWPTKNSWNDEAYETFQGIAGSDKLGASKRDRYAIAPEDMLKAQREARDRHLQIVGIYHSHPDHPAIPSEFDRACAWPVYSYIIVSVHIGKIDTHHSWILDDAHQFQPEEIENLS